MVLALTGRSVTDNRLLYLSGVNLANVDRAVIPSSVAEKRHVHPVGKLSGGSWVIPVPDHDHARSSPIDHDLRAITGRNSLVEPTAAAEKPVVVPKTWPSARPSTMSHWYSTMTGLASSSIATVSMNSRRPRPPTELQTGRRPNLART